MRRDLKYLPVERYILASPSYSTNNLVQLNVFLIAYECYALYVFVISIDLTNFIDIKLRREGYEPIVTYNQSYQFYDPSNEIRWADYIISKWYVNYCKKFK